MPLAIEVSVDGALARKIEALKLASTVVSDRINRQVRDSAFSVAAHATNLVPVSTGALRRSIKPTFFFNGFAAVIASYLPYAARQEFDMTLDHTPRPPRRRTRNTMAGRRGSIIKGTGQSNPSATWGFLRKALAKEHAAFLNGMKDIADMFGDSWLA